MKLGYAQWLGSLLHSKTQALSDAHSGEAPRGIVWNFNMGEAFRKRFNTGSTKSLWTSLSYSKEDCCKMLCCSSTMFNNKFSRELQKSIRMNQVVGHSFPFLCGFHSWIIVKSGDKKKKKPILLKEWFLQIKKVEQGFVYLDLDWFWWTKLVMVIFFSFSSWKIIFPNDLEFMVLPRFFLWRSDGFLITKVCSVHLVCIKSGSWIKTLRVKKEIICRGPLKLVRRFLDPRTTSSKKNSRKTKTVFGPFWFDEGHERRKALSQGKWL